jgi:hypothetical protein
LAVIGIGGTWVLVRLLTETRRRKLGHRVPLWLAMPGALCFLITTHVTPAQDLPSASPNTNRAIRDARTVADNRRSEAVQIVKAFAQRVESFQTFQIKAVVLARMEDILWPDDQQYARTVFSKALDVCAVAELGDQTQQKTARQARREVVSILLRRDPEWAKKYLVKAEASDSRDSSNATVAEAINLVSSNTDRSIDLARDSLRASLSTGFVYYLKELQRKNPSAANQLFLDALDRLAAPPLLDGNQFLLLGTYLFTGNIPASDDIHMMNQIGIGGVLVYDISKDRTGMPPDLVRAYLRTATDLMSSAAESDNAEQKQLYYLVGYLLNRRIDQFTPEIAGVFGAKASCPDLLLPT